MLRCSVVRPGRMHTLPRPSPPSSELPSSRSAASAGSAAPQAGGSVPVRLLCPRSSSSSVVLLQLAGSCPSKLLLPRLMLAEARDSSVGGRLPAGVVQLARGIEAGVRTPACTRAARQQGAANAQRCAAGSTRCSAWPSGRPHVACDFASCHSGALIQRQQRFPAIYCCACALLPSPPPNRLSPSLATASCGSAPCCNHAAGSAPRNLLRLRSRVESAWRPANAAGSVPCSPRPLTFRATTWPAVLHVTPGHGPWPPAPVPHGLLPSCQAAPPRPLVAASQLDVASRSASSTVAAQRHERDGGPQGQVNSRLLRVLPSVKECWQAGNISGVLDMMTSASLLVPGESMAACSCLRHFKARRCAASKPRSPRSVAVAPGRTPCGSTQSMGPHVASGGVAGLTPPTDTPKRNTAAKSARTTTLSSSCLPSSGADTTRPSSSSSAAAQMASTCGSEAIASRYRAPCRSMCTARSKFRVNKQANCTVQLSPLGPTQHSQQQTSQFWRTFCPSTFLPLSGCLIFLAIIACMQTESRMYATLFPDSKQDTPLLLPGSSVRAPVGRVKLESCGEGWQLPSSVHMS